MRSQIRAVRPLRSVMKGRRNVLANLPWPAVALLVLSSCGPVTSAPVDSPGPSDTQAVTKPCKLPVGIGRGTSGFVAYPAGSFTPDPSSDISGSPYRGPNATSVGGLGAPSYDWSARRWLPVKPALI